MKLLFISSPSFADCDFPLIKAFQEKGIDVTYLILLPPFFLKSTLFNINKQISKTAIIPATDYKEFLPYTKYMDMSKVFIANRTGRSRYSLSFWKHKYDLYKFIKDGNFDLIHTDLMLPPSLNFIYRLGVKCIQTVHDPFPHSGEDNSKKKSSYNSVMKSVKNFILLNNKQKEDFCSAYDIDPSHVYINRLGVYDNIKTFVNPDWKIRKNNVLFFGRISPYKGVEYLCEAMTLVRKECPDATLTIAGGGKMYFDIEPYKQLGYVEVINRYVGMEELAELLFNCEITVCPYTDATQSGVIMTSFALSKPVVASNVGGLGEMINDGITGLLVKPQDIESLADSIVKLLTSDEMKKMMVYNISRIYESGDMSWSSIANNYLNFYNKIL